MFSHFQISEYYFDVDAVHLYITSSLLSNKHLMINSSAPSLEFALQNEY